MILLHCERFGKLVVVESDAVVRRIEQDVLKTVVGVIAHLDLTR